MIRMVCRRLESIVTPMLFADVPLWIEKKSLQDLLSIAESQRL